MMEVQVFGTQKHADVRKALRFFQERRVKVHFVDFKERGPARGELSRWVQKFGVTALVDRASRRYADLGLGASRYGDDRWVELLCDEPLVLVQPLVRWKHRLSVGMAEADWTAWVAEGTA
jgi:arsenate reductase-like glutaredoxin family protein